MQHLPIKLYRTDQVRELDRLAIQKSGIPGFELMSRAGYEVFQCIRQKWPDTQTLAVFCGAGNNAGDGYIIARLALEAGLEVYVYSVVEPITLKGDAHTAYQRYIHSSGAVIPFQGEEIFQVDVIVDALLGTGLDRPVTGLFAHAIQFINNSTAQVVAVDNPSGLNANTGNVMGCAVKAEFTVTFIALKQGLFTGQAADYCGEIIYASLAVSDAVIQAVDSSTVRVVKTPLPQRDRCTHKGNYGHVLIVGGDWGYSGAALLAGEAALCVGAGLVSIATRTEHAGLMNLKRPELMCHGVANSDQLAPLLAKSSVVVIGPGLGQSDWARELLMTTLTVQKPLLIDADGLNLLAQLPVKNPDWILTPHPGEASRLLGCSTAEIQQDRFASVSAIQSKYDGIAILKGAGTLIASPDEIAVSTTGNPGMSSGGMGDVLSGVIAGFLAQNLSLKIAAQQGVFCHGMAADLAAEKDGERGLLASDLMPHLRLLVN